MQNSVSCFSNTFFITFAPLSSTKTVQIVVSAVEKLFVHRCGFSLDARGRSAFARVCSDRKQVLVFKRLSFVLDVCDNRFAVTVEQNGESTAVSATAVEVVLPLVVNAYLLTFRSHLADDVAKVLLTSSPTGSVRRLCLSLCQREFRLR